VRGRAQAAAVAARWRTVEPRGGVARAREGQGGGARAVLGLGATRGGEGSRRWRRGGAGVVVSGADGRRQRSRAGEQSMCQRKKKRERSPKDLFGICKNLRDFTVN
jgi:hypothetical protein